MRLAAWTLSWLAVAACTPSRDKSTSGATPSASSASASCVEGATCAPEGASCSPTPIGTGWAHAMMCSGGKWQTIEIAPLGVPPPSTSTSGTPLQQDSPPSSAWLGFRAYPGAREVCSQSILGSGAEIHWTMYASADPIERARAFYAQDHLDHDELRQGDDILSVYAKGASYPTCEQKLADAEQTVFVVSRRVARP